MSPSAALSFEQAPPISVPFRFFLTGPLFGAAAGLVIAADAGAVLASRWSFTSFAAVHLITAGFMLQVMCGAMLQFLPVAAGANVWRPRLVAGLVHPALTLGGIALAFGFLGAGARAMQAAAVLLGAGLTLFAGATGAGLARSPAIGPTLALLKAAVASLVVTAGLGVALATAFGWGAAVPVVVLVELHAAWGIGGWALLLLVAVALLVVPMFQLTPPYPVPFTRWLGRSIGAGLGLWSVGVVAGVAALEWTGTALGTGALLAFAWKTLALQSKRRRKVTDTTLRAWRVGLACVIAAAVLLVAARALPPGGLRDRAEYLVGVALLAGAFPSMMAGMLYKIVGFLDWLHLQRVMANPPLMHKVLPDAQARWQWWASTASVVLLLGGAAWPPLARLGGLTFALACVILEVHLVQAVRLYRRLLVAAMTDARATPGVASTASLHRSDRLGA